MMVALTAVLTTILLVLGSVLPTPSLRRPLEPEAADVLAAQLNWLQHALQHGAADRMQRMFPEGYVFSWGLYGVAAAQAAALTVVTPAHRDQLLQRSLDAVRALRSVTARRPFDPGLKPPFGMFYNAWSVYLRAVTLRSFGTHVLGAAGLAEFERDCSMLAEIFDTSETPFVPTYSGQAWPSDSVTGIAALAIHDQLFAARFKDVIARWKQLAQARLDPQFAVLAHAADPQSGEPLGGARGSSLALVARLLVDVDPRWAHAHLQVLKEHFLVQLRPLAWVREYPHGRDGLGDVDSGPLLFGVGGPATIVAAAAARASGDQPLADALLRNADWFGLPGGSESRLFYAGGLLPVGDAFVAWTRSTPVPDAPINGENGAHR